MGAWQEEKDKLDRKKALIFAESSYSPNYNFYPPDQLAERFSDKQSDYIFPKDIENYELYDELFRGTKTSYPMFRGGEHVGEKIEWENMPLEEQLYDLQDDFTAVTDITSEGNLVNWNKRTKTRKEKRDHIINTLETLIGPSMVSYSREDVKGSEGIPNIPSEYIRKEDIFPNQANWWAAQNPDIDTEIVDFRGLTQLREELDRIKETGFMDEGDISAVLMGHADPTGRYGGVTQPEFGAILDEKLLDDKFNDVTLASCHMGDNPLACMNISESFGNVPVTGQNKWSWGTGHISKDSLGNPDLSVSERMLVSGVESTTFNAGDAGSWSPVVSELMSNEDDDEGSGGVLNQFKHYLLNNPELDANTIMKEIHDTSREIAVEYVGREGRRNNPERVYQQKMKETMLNIMNKAELENSPDWNP
jgi:hypothetical protein